MLFFMLVRQLSLKVTQLLHVMCNLTCIQSNVGGGVGVQWTRTITLPSVNSDARFKENYAKYETYAICTAFRL